jgi:hypothetical protein
MPQHFSRSQWAQITKRVKKAQYVFSEHWKCFVCGIAFNSRVCTHSRDDNEQVLTRAKAEAGVAD